MNMGKQSRMFEFWTNALTGHMPLFNIEQLMKRPHKKHAQKTRKLWIVVQNTRKLVRCSFRVFGVFRGRN